MERSPLVIPVYLNEIQSEQSEWSESQKDTLDYARYDGVMSFRPSEARGVNLKGDTLDYATKLLRSV